VITSNWNSHMAPTVIVLAAGIPLVIVAVVMSKGEFFKTKPVAYTTIEE